MGASTGCVSTPKPPPLRSGGLPIPLQYIFAPFLLRGKGRGWGCHAGGSIIRVLVLACALLTLTPSTHAQPNIPACDPNTPLANGDPATSSDARYTVWTDCYAPDAEGYAVYAYDTETDTTIELGVVTDTRRGVTGDTIVTAYVARWIDEDTVLLRAETGGGTYNWRYAFVADADTPESLRLLAADYVSRPRFEADPDHIIWTDEDGVSETFTVLYHPIDADEPQPLYTGDCLLRDDLETPLSCHMVTAHTNATFTDDSEPSLLVLNIGDSAREVKTVEVRALPSGHMLYTVDGLGSAYAEWVGVDTVAVFNLAFDFETGGFAGVFLRVGADGTTTDEVPFSTPNGEPLTDRPPWMEDAS